MPQCNNKLNKEIYFICWLSTVILSGLALNSSNPNILLIVVDDLRPSLNCYGDKLAISPNIDALALDGIKFGKAYAQQALCGPSRASFLTSRRPDTLKQVDVHYYWRNHVGNFTSMPQYFKENGYYAVSAGKIFHPGITSGKTDDYPFSWSEKPFHPSTQKHKEDAVCMGQDGSLHTNIYCPVTVELQPEGTLPDIQTTEYVTKWLQNYHSNELNGITNAIRKPFFLAVGFHKPHIPLKFPKEYLELYPIESFPAKTSYFPEGLPSPSWNPWNDLRRRDDITFLNVSFPYGPMPIEYSRYIRQGYYASISYMDALVGKVTAQVKKLYPNTIIVLIGDHGWSLGEHQEWSKFSNYEVATRVPFIISMPPHQNQNTRKERGKNKLGKLRTYRRRKNAHKNFATYDGVVELLDLFPTLIDLASLPRIPVCSKSSVLTCTEGISLACIIENTLRHRGHTVNNNRMRDCTKRKVAMSQYPRPGMMPSLIPDSDQPKLTETSIMGYSLTSNRYRYTLWVGFNHSTFAVDLNKIFNEELYDHFEDPGENVNIIYSNDKIFLANSAKRVLLKKLNIG